MAQTAVRGWPQHSKSCAKSVLVWPQAHDRLSWSQPAHLPGFVDKRSSGFEAPGLPHQRPPLFSHRDILAGSLRIRRVYSFIIKEGGDTCSADKNCLRLLVGCVEFPD